MKNGETGGIPERQRVGFVPVSVCMLKIAFSSKHCCASSESGCHGSVVLLVSGVSFSDIRGKIPRCPSWSLFKVTSYAATSNPLHYPSVFSTCSSVTLRQGACQHASHLFVLTETRWPVSYWGFVSTSLHSQHNGMIWLTLPFFFFLFLSFHDMNWNDLCVLEHF